MRHLTLAQEVAIEALCEQGYISARKNPFFPQLTIYNYTKKTQFECFWNPFTIMCRGLVVDNSGDVVIDCPKKFFNQIEPEAPSIKLWEPDDIVFTEKLDGYYISFRQDSRYGLIVTSRGSFDNQYVQAALPKIPSLNILPDVDYFCELCQNFAGDEEIIVTKHTEPSLILWGVNEGVPYVPETTDSCFDPENCPLPIAKTYDHSSVIPYLEQQVEGVVAYNVKTRQRVKIKTDWYLQRHRFLSGISFKEVLLHLVAGEPLSENEIVPEEHLPLVKKWEQKCEDKYKEYEALAREVCDQWKDRSDKDLALDISVRNDIKTIVFAIRQGKDYEKTIWKCAKRELLRDATN